MPNQKNQHFVPQFYQRFFSSDNKNIDSYLIKENKIVSSPIKSTASKNYMYSIDGEEKDGADFEKILSLLESRIAETFKYVIANPIQKLDGSHRFWLLFSALLQEGRTDLSSYNLQTVLVELDSQMLVGQGVPQDTAKLLLADLFSKPAPLSIDSTLANISCCIDLDIKVLVNNTAIAFITSDNPVCRWNHWYEEHGVDSLGWGSRGLVCYYPISPKIGVLLYDGVVYEHDSPDTDYIELNDENDVMMLNMAVHYYADNILLFNKETIQEDDIIKLVNRQEHLERQDRMVIDFFNYNGNDKMYVYQKYVKGLGWLSFIRMKKEWYDCLLDQDTFYRYKQNPVEDGIIDALSYHIMKHGL